MSSALTTPPVYDNTVLVTELVCIVAPTPTLPTARAPAIPLKLTVSLAFTSRVLRFIPLEFPVT